jgi:hypothetical protein
MSLNLTPLQSDSFQRANVSPLTSPWTIDEDNDAGFQIVSEVAEPSLGSTECAQFYTYSSTPNDQYCSATLAAALGASSFLMIKVRTTDTGGIWINLPGYRLYVTSAGAWHVYRDSSGGQTQLLSGTGLTISSGDVYTLAAVGTTIYAYQNSVLLGSVTDTTYASGSVMLGGEGSGSASGLQISNFVMGSAAVASTYSISGNCGVAAATVSYSGTASGSVTADGSGNYTISGLANGSYTITPSAAGYSFSPASANETVNGANITGVNFTDYSGSLPPVEPGEIYLGSVTVVSGIPAGKNDCFLGRVHLVNGPPAGRQSPYLGHIRYVASAPNGGSGNLIGDVYVIASAPAGNTDPWLGSAISA